MRDIHNGLDVIDSRDVIRKLAELQDDRDAAEVLDAQDAPDERFHTADGKLFDAAVWSDDEEAEYQALKSFADEGEANGGDWHHGESLIRDSYFERYARELAEDLGPLQDGWPYDYIDWEKAADALKADYRSIDWDGIEYWVRA